MRNVLRQSKRKSGSKSRGFNGEAKIDGEPHGLNDDASEGESESAGEGAGRSKTSAKRRAFARRRGAGPKSRRPEKPHKEGKLRKIMNSWWDRLLGGVSSHSFSNQEAQYESHKTSRDFMWNSIGLGVWGMVFPLLTIVVTQLSGLELAGMFSLAFVTASLLMIVANYGVRTFQVSDLNESHSFSDYQVNRWITCIAMIVIGVLYCNVRGYTGEMFLISIGVYLYKMVDGLADVYEGRLQQKDKLYLAGISQTIRSGLVFVVFTLFLLITRNLGGACIAMAVTAIATFILVTAPLALLETPASRKPRFESVKLLFQECAPLFVALFLYSFIDNMPKFMMEGLLSYDNQLYFNALYFPAQAILMTVGLIYKPLLVKMAAAWADVNHRRRFDLFIVVMVLVILAITAVGAFFMDFIGIPIMSFLYGTDFEPFRKLSLIMIVAGGVTGIIDFLYQVITVLRKQRVVMRLYLMTFVCALFVPVLMISMTGLTGAVTSYLVLMAILLVLLLWEYVSVRVTYLKNPESEEPLSDIVPSHEAYADNALMMQNGSGLLGGYPVAYVGVKPAKSTGEGRARRKAAHEQQKRKAASGQQAAAQRAGKSAREGVRTEGSQAAAPRDKKPAAAGSQAAAGERAAAVRKMPSAAGSRTRKLSSEVAAARKDELTTRADGAAEHTATAGAAERPVTTPATPYASPAVADVSTGRAHEAGSPFQREMAERVSASAQANDTHPDSAGDADDASEKQEG